MKRGLLILIAAVTLGGGMFYGSRWLLSCGCAVAGAVPTERGSLLPELQWLRHSLDLNDGQFEKVKALHLAYQPTCEALCLRIRGSNQALLEAATKSRAVEGGVAGHLRERADLALECQQAMLRHVYETAACMQPEQADKYLRLVLPPAFGVDDSRADGGHISH